MPKVNCPGCKSLITFDPDEGTSISCPACGKQLRVKMPVKAAPAFAPKPRPTAVVAVREPVEQEEDESLPLRRKKKKKSRGPSGEVSGLLLPLGGLATLLLVGLMIWVMHHEAEKAKTEAGGVAYLIAITVAAVAIGIGALITQYSVNSLARRNRVPTIEFSEAACLYPLVAFSGILGAAVMILPILLFASSGDPVPRQDSYFGLKFLLGFFAVVGGFIGATMTTIKFLLNTRWKDAGSISARFVVVGFLTNLLINIVTAAVVAGLKAD